jgi:hypothetical protein
MYTYYILYIANGAQPKVAGGGANGGGGGVKEVPGVTVAGVRRNDSCFWREVGSRARGREEEEEEETRRWGVTSSLSLFLSSLPLLFLSLPLH